MKILFFSDVHGIYTNLEKLVNLDKQENFDKIVCLGDLYYCGPFYSNFIDVNTNKVFDILTNWSKKLICVRGNCDSDVDIKASDFPICDKLSLLLVDGLNIYLTHGNEYNKDKNNKFINDGILMYGHEHYPYIKKDNNMIYINVGSISLPRNNSKPSFAIYENKEIKLYDIENNVLDFIKL